MKGEHQNPLSYSSVLCCCLNGFPKASCGSRRIIIVHYVRKAEDYNTTGQWKVTTCRVTDMVEEEEKVSAEFDGVMLYQRLYSVLSLEQES